MTLYGSQPPEQWNTPAKDRTLICSGCSLYGRCHKEAECGSDLQGHRFSFLAPSLSPPPGTSSPFPGLPPPICPIPSFLKQWMRGLTYCLFHRSMAKINDRDLNAPRGGSARLFLFSIPLSVMFSIQTCQLPWNKPESGLLHNWPCPGDVERCLGL